MSLSDFKLAFTRYLDKEEIKFPLALEDKTDIEFAMFVNTFLKPLYPNTEKMRLSVESLIEINGYDVPPLNEKQRERVERYMLAFVESLTAE
jgi:hypothetical protein